MLTANTAVVVVVVVVDLFFFFGWLVGWLDGSKRQFLLAQLADTCC